jgi:transcriptional regulator with XRE-family HTH domain
MTMADRIRALIAKGKTNAEIVEALGCSRARVSNVRRRDADPGYNARWMAKKRAENPAAYLKELDKQRKYRSKRVLAETGRRPKRYSTSKARERILARIEGTA